MADNTFTHVCSRRLISPSYLPQPKAKLHARKSAHTQTPPCTITLFEERDACSLQPRRCTLKPVVCLEWERRYVDMCVKGWRRGAGSWRTTRRREEVRTSSLPDRDAGGAATVAASPECCRYGNMRRADENIYVRTER